MIRGIPAFWLGILLLMALSYGTGLFPNGGMRSHFGGRDRDRRWRCIFSTGFRCGI